MPNCHEMKKGEVYVCEDCGLELRVIKECKEAGTGIDECACHTISEPCNILCCGKEFVKKQS